METWVLAAIILASLQNTTCHIQTLTSVGPHNHHLIDSDVVVVNGQALRLRLAVDGVQKKSIQELKNTVWTDGDYLGILYEVKEHPKPLVDLTEETSDWTLVVGNSSRKVPYFRYVDVSPDGRIMVIKRESNFSEETAKKLKIKRIDWILRVQDNRPESSYYKVTYTDGTEDYATSEFSDYKQYQVNSTIAWN